MNSRACGIEQPCAEDNSRTESTGLNADTMCYRSENVLCNFWKIPILCAHYVRLAPTVSNIRDAKYTANFHNVRVAIIMIRTHLPTVRSYFTRWICIKQWITIGDRFTRVSYWPHFEVLGVPHHHWTYHMNQKKSKHSLKSWWKMKDCCSVHLHVLWQANLYV